MVSLKRWVRAFSISVFLIALFSQYILAAGTHTCAEVGLNPCTGDIASSGTISAGTQLISPDIMTNTLYAGTSVTSPRLGCTGTSSMCFTAGVTGASSSAALWSYAQGGAWTAKLLGAAGADVLIGQKLAVGNPSAVHPTNALEVYGTAKINNGVISVPGAKFGVGTLTPTAELDVVGLARAQRLRVTSTSTLAGWPAVFIEEQSPGTSYRYALAASAGGGASSGASSIAIRGDSLSNAPGATTGGRNIGGYFSASGNTFNRGVEVNVPYDTNNFAIYSGGAAKSFFSGDIGLGTTSPEPGSKLTIEGGDATIRDGKLVLTKVKTLTDADGDGYYVPGVSGVDVTTITGSGLTTTTIPSGITVNPGDDLYDCQDSYFPTITSSRIHKNSEYWKRVSVGGAVPASPLDDINCDGSTSKLTERSITAGSNCVCCETKPDKYKLVRDIDTDEAKLIRHICVSAPCDKCNDPFHEAYTFCATYAAEAQSLGTLGTCNQLNDYYQ
ncbi:hypothetical protein J4227_04985 [Candidatus Woesearchaeota archaeon]|nr:hypothetical protein [Candidatus Woesearchaeota archaeon]